MIALITGSRMFAAADVVNTALRETYDRALDVRDAALTGSRPAWGRLYEAFGDVLAPDLVGWHRDDRPVLTVRHGACPPRTEDGVEVPGADELASRWVRSMSHAVDEDPWPADWARYGREAGPIRNAQMVQAEPVADLCLSFFALGQRHRGTRGCVDLALERGIPVWAYDEHGRMRLNRMPGKDQRHRRAVSA